MQPKSWVIRIASCWMLALWCGNSVAEVFETHARIRLFGAGYVVSSPWSSSFSREYYTTGDESFIFADPFTGGEGPYASVSSAAAFVSPLAADFLGVGASTILGYSGAQAFAAWRDVTYYGSSSGAGSFIRLYFSVQAELGGARGTGSYVRVSGLTNLSEDVFGEQSGPLSEVRFWDPGIFDPDLGLIPNPGYFVTGPWDNYRLEGETFVGTTHLDVPYDEKFGGYSWQLEIEASSGASNVAAGPGFASSLRSVGLTAVTDLDGNPITGLSFDSGMTYVPEVPSMYMLAGAGLVLFTYARWRSVRSSAAAL